MGRWMLLAALAGFLLAPADAQRPGSTAAPGRSGPPPGAAGGAPPRGVATPLAPTPEAEARLSRIERIKEAAERDPEKEKDGGGGKGRLNRAERLRMWRLAVEERLAHVKDLAITFEVRELLADGESRRLLVDYVQVRAGRRLLHRLAILAGEGEVTEPVEELLLHEIPGHRPEAWRREPGDRWRTYEKNALDHPIGSAGLAVRDVLPFEPGRYRLAFVEEAERDGDRVDVFEATPRSGTVERLELSFTAGEHHLVRLKARQSGAEHRVIVDTNLRDRGGLRAFERRRVLFPRGGEQVVVQMIKREANRGIDPAELNPHP